MRKMSDLVRDQNPLTLPPSASALEAARHMRDRREEPGRDDPVGGHDP